MSKQFKSLKEYLEEHQYDALFKRVSNYIYINQKNLDIKNYDSDDYSYARLDEIHISTVSAEKFDDESIKLIIQIQSDIILKFGKDRDYDEDTVYKWVTVYATTSLKNEFKDFKITDVCEYESKTFSKWKSLSRGFIPCIYNDDLDTYAEKFLKEYCPEALVSPIQPIFGS